MFLEIVVEIVLARCSNT